MEFNANNFELLRYGASQHQQVINVGFKDTFSLGIFTEKKADVCDLGITLSSDATSKQYHLKVCFEEQIWLDPASI